MKTTIKLWLGYAIFILILLITFNVDGQEGSVIINEIEFAEDVPPTVVIMHKSITHVAKISSANIESRKDSYIRINSAEFDLLYVINYSDGVYEVRVTNYPANWVDIESTPLSPESIFMGTRVDEVRKWFIGEVIGLYDRFQESI